ncbi:hypothetical protein EJ08DRAFT_586398 [Tothia fuscella]|uniref:Sm domain-containing protein n=1 Tax=Tothia fuscella TaxID=1048955 RepID=A0A9P4NVD7_9PEZI|nr:hypothetical protein EJ08DRAFT_586398 [Tothia fuscella]
MADPPPSPLSTYLSRTIRVHTTDSRIFVGQMKCTDRECNIVLGLAQEYRPPPDSVLQTKAVEQGIGSGSGSGSGIAKLNVQFSSRYVGLVVVPGKYIRKIEVEEYIGGGGGGGGV